MATPPSRKTGPVAVPAPEPSVDIVPILVSRKVLTGMARRLHEADSKMAKSVDHLEQVRTELLSQMFGKKENK